MSPFGGGPAPLTQRDGQTPVGLIEPGVEVTISAWLPHREGTRYLVSLVSGAEQGWLQTTHLLARPRPVTPKPPVAAVVAKPKPRVRKKVVAAVAVVEPTKAKLPAKSAKAR